jgi:hypothetical protein
MPEGKEPQVAGIDIVHEAAAVLIDGGDARRTGDHVGPFVFLVPVQLAHAGHLFAAVEVHLHPGDFFGDRQLALGDLVCPTTGLQAHVCIGKREAEVRHRAGVRAWWQ